MKNAVILPTYNRPESLKRFCDSFNSTSKHSQLFVVLDKVDPKFDECVNICTENQVVTFVTPFRQRLSSKINFGWMNSLNYMTYAYYNNPEKTATHFSFYGDDVVFNTEDWDLKLMEACNGNPFHIVYPNDGQRLDLPNHWTVTSKIAAATGFLSLPCLDHMYVDMFWLEVGNQLGVIRRADEVKTTHLHPAYDPNVEKDENYNSSQELYKSDEYMFNAFKGTGKMQMLIDKLKPILKE